jgi:type II secretory pathway pseudopilin PulG
MPISYSCPHCSKQFSVADQYAGQSGPCAACGQTITIPFPMPTFGGPGGISPTAAAGVGASLATVLILVIVAILSIVGILVALLIPAVGAARQAAKRAQSTNYMRQLGIAMHNYHDMYGCFPPPVVKDANGKPLYSGRVLLLPFIEQAHMYEAWDKTQSWDSPVNQTLSRSIIATFRDPADTGAPGQTSYLFVSGPGTIGDPESKVDFRSITDGSSNTIMFVEVKNSGISWAEPRDWDASSTLPPGNHKNGNIVGFADGSVRTISPQTPPQTLKAATTRAGGEAVFLP